MRQRRRRGRVPAVAVVVVVVPEHACFPEAEASRRGGGWDDGPGPRMWSCVTGLGVRGRSASVCLYCMHVCSLSPHSLPTHAARHQPTASVSRSLGLFSFPNSSPNSTMQKEDSLSHQNAGTYMKY
jgi:hypothetical protein